MFTHKHSILWAVMTLSLAPALALAAQTLVVPPPMPSYGAATPQAGTDLINVVLPTAPEQPPVADLKPGAPGTGAVAPVIPVKHKSKKHKKSKKSHQQDPEAPGTDAKESKRHEVLDPFSGVVGIPISDSQLNRFVFPEPVEGVYFPEGTPLPDCAKDAGPQDPCKPVFLNGRKLMLLQLRAGAMGPVQMLVHLHSGAMTTLNLAPAQGPGAVVRVAGAEDGPSDARIAESRASRSTNAEGMQATEADVTLLARFARGEIPGGFEPQKVGRTVRYDLFDAVPMATWSNGSTLRARLMEIHARGTTPVTLETGLFRKPGILALALDRTTVTATTPALLYVLEQLQEEE